MIMFKYFAIFCNGVQGGNYYKTAQEAQAAADRRNAIHGRQWWTVKEIWAREPNMDDDRPYCPRWSRVYR